MGENMDMIGVSISTPTTLQQPIYAIIPLMNEIIMLINCRIECTASNFGSKRQ